MTLSGAPPSRPDLGGMTARYRGGRQAVEYAILRARRHKDKAQAETLLTRTTGGSGLSVTQRLAAGARRLKSTGPRTSSRRSRRSYAGTEAGAVAVQDADHPRHQPGGALPRLGGQGPALRCQDHAATSGGQRGSRAVRAQDRHPAAVRALHEQGNPAQCGAQLHDDLDAHDGYAAH